VDDEELEGIRCDVRTLRTDLGLDLESKNKKDLSDEEKRNKLNSDKDIKKTISNRTCDQNDVLTKFDGTSTINAYFSTKVSSNQDSFTDNKNVDKVDNRRDGNSDDTGECKSDSRIDASTTHTAPPHTNTTHPSPPVTEGVDSIDGLESVDGLDVTMFTPSILLLVDEIAALEKDILKRHTDITAAQVISLIFLLFFFFSSSSSSSSLLVFFFYSLSLLIFLSLTRVLPSVLSLAFFILNLSTSLFDFIFRPLTSII
jgi:hypothetical protein